MCPWCGGWLNDYECCLECDFVGIDASTLVSMLSWASGVIRGHTRGGGR